MKKRIISAAVLIPVLLVLVLAAPKLLTAVVFGALLAIAAYELLYRTGLMQHTRLVAYSCAMAFLVSLWSYAGAVHAYAVLGVLCFTMILFAEMMHDHVKVQIDMVAECYLAGIVIPYLLSALIRILTMKIGRYLILLPFVVAYMNDAGAYFVGMKYGRHKLAPVVSPNKTVEGVLGGLGATLVGVLIYALVLRACDFYVNFLLVIPYALVGGLAGVFGDLCFSIIKRQTGIKDYGDLIPGHGGILDRFDSLSTVAPLIEVLLAILPLAVS